jgi:oligosaccharide repeat unit polymerase
MLLISVFILSLLAIINYGVSKKAILYPPVVFCATWAASIFIIWVFQSVFYPMLPETLAFFLCGALAFSAGAWAATMTSSLRPSRQAVTPVFQKSVTRTITVLLLVVIVGTPIYFYWLFHLTLGSALTFLQATRNKSIELMGQDTTFTLFGTLGELSFMVAMLAFFERNNHPRRSTIAIIFALIMSISTGSKAGPLSIIVALVVIYWIKARRIQWKILLTTFIFSIIVAGLINFYSHFGGGSFSETLPSVVDAFPLYSSGGLVAFDRVVRDPHIVPHFDQLVVTVLRIARKLGASDIEIHENAEFVSIGPQEFFQDNVYTMYWSYLDMGYAGSITVAGIIGFIVTWVYHRAIKGHRISIMLYATLLYGVFFSTFTEYFSGRLYFFSKLCLLTWVVYYFPARWKQFRRFTGAVVSSDMAASSACRLSQ